MRFVFLVVILLGGAQAQAFPEFVRHGYTSCLACHVSVNGGGILTEYGRELSRELISTWGKEKESQFAYGVVPLPSFLNLGGDFRWLQLAQENDQIDRGLFFNMQMDLEAAVYVGPLTFVGTIGRNVSLGDEPDTVFSRRHYVSYALNENIMVRGGKFYPEYGINNGNHNRFVRQFFGFEQGEETYNAELVYQTETYSAFLTAIFGRPDTNEESEQRDAGGAATFNYYLWEKHRFGVSYKFGMLDDETRHQFSAFTILGLDKSFFIQAEYDFKIQSSDSNDALNVNSWADLIRINWEAYKGINLYVMQQMYVPEIGDVTNDIQAYGFGVQFFPRPHWELVGEYQLRSVPGLDGFSENYYYFLFHFYL